MFLWPSLTRNSYRNRNRNHFSVVFCVHRTQLYPRIKHAPRPSSSPESASSILPPQPQPESPFPRPPSTQCPIPPLLPSQPLAWPASPPQQPRPLFSSPQALSPMFAIRPPPDYSRSTTHYSRISPTTTDSACDSPGMYVMCMRYLMLLTRPRGRLLWVLLAAQSSV